MARRAGTRTRTLVNRDAGRIVRITRPVGVRPSPPRVLAGAERKAHDDDFAATAAAWASSRPSPEETARERHARELRHARRQLAGAWEFAADLWAKDPEMGARPLDLSSRALRDTLAPFSRAYYAFEIATLVRLARADLRHAEWLSHADHREALGLTIAEARWLYLPWVRQQRGRIDGADKGWKTNQDERAKENAPAHKQWLVAARQIAAERVREELPPASGRELARLVAARCQASENTVRKFLRAKTIK